MATPDLHPLDTSYQNELADIPEIERLRERMRKAAKLNMELMEIRHDNEAEIERLRRLLRDCEKRAADYADVIEGERDLCDDGSG